MNSQERVAAIKERLAKATPGPWHVSASGGTMLLISSEHQVVAAVQKRQLHDHESEEPYAKWGEADADLIAAAPELLRTLINELTELRERGDRAERVARMEFENRIKYEQRFGAAKSRIKQMEEALRESADEMDALSDTWHGAGQGQLRGIAIRLRTLTQGTENTQCPACGARYPEDTQRKGDGVICSDAFHLGVDET